MELDTLLRRGADAGIISPEQAEQLRALAREGGASPEDVAVATTPARSGPSGPAPVGAEAPRGFNAVSVAYGVGALLVVFAFGWFLFDRWERLGPLGVLGVAAVYAAALGAMARWLGQRGYPAAAGVAVMLIVSLTPIATWAVLRLSGRWPDPPRANAFYVYAPWMAYQWLVIELCTVLSALLVLRWRRIAAVTYPLAAALWGLQYHLGQLGRDGYASLGYDRWIMLANALAILVVADFVTRWQAREQVTERTGARGTAREPDTTQGDFAGAFWIVGLIAFGFAYAELWDDAGRWRHLLPVVALSLIVMSLYLRRRVVLAGGMIALFAYLAWLSDTVLRQYISFPIVLAALGIAMIAATVWVQRRFPQLVSRLDATRGERARTLPWRAPLSLLAPLSALVLAIAAGRDAADERAQIEFRERWWILREHAHRWERARARRAPQ